MIKLTASNYSLWRPRMEDLLDCKYLSDPLEDEGKKPDKVTDQNSHWEVTDKAVRAASYLINKSPSAPLEFEVPEEALKIRGVHSGPNPGTRVYPDWDSGLEPGPEPELGWFGSDPGRNLGAHNIGFAQCFTFKSRLFKFANGKPDPTLDASLIQTLQSTCPEDDADSDTKLSPLDSVTANKFDNIYYENLGFCSINGEDGQHRCAYRTEWRDLKKL
ncbi:putative Peroxidase 48 [Juglans microcarpa x Juglans regia]|uniref:putative Peroxidase 48 n=1 Tax=Juglans microcarpa x Juglans regia TaxID=2249226 RepID=UPI001B7DA52D|nr:putative Peroxidase 48 [Juglans microcarpa x Juglans regia]